MRYLVSGPPASGKSTLAGLLALPGVQVIDFDAIARELGSPSTHDHPRDVARAAAEEFGRRVDALDGPAVVIRSAPTRDEREEWARRAGADHVIVLATPADDAKRRAVEAGRPEWTAAAIDRWWRLYEPETTRTAGNAHTGSAQAGATPDEERSPMSEAESPKPSGDEGKERTFTQAELDHIVGERVQRERAKYADYDDLKAKADGAKSAEDRIADLEKRLADADAKEARRVLVEKVATKHGIANPDDIRLFLTGSDEDTLTAQAKRLAERDADSRKKGDVSPNEGNARNTSDGASPWREVLNRLDTRTN